MPHLQKNIDPTKNNVINYTIVDVYNCLCQMMKNACRAVNALDEEYVTLSKFLNKNGIYHTLERKGSWNTLKDTFCVITFHRQEGLMMELQNYHSEFGRTSERYSRFVFTIDTEGFIKGLDMSEERKGMTTVDGAYFANIKAFSLGLIKYYYTDEVIDELKAKLNEEAI